MNWIDKITELIKLNSRGKLLCATILLVFFNSTCLFYITGSINHKTDQYTYFSYVLNRIKPGSEKINSEKKKNMSEELEVFQYILRYSRLKHDLAFELANTIMDNCDEYDVDPFLVLAVIKVESNFKPKAVSGMGAIGLMQLMPSTARYVSEKFELEFQGKNSLFNPHTNVKYGVAYLSLLKERYKKIEHALLAYNYGPTRYLSIRDSLSNSMPYYVKQVLSFKSILERESVIVSES